MLVDRLGEQRPLGERVGNDRTLVAAQEEERHAAPLELVADREAGIAMQVDVDDGTVDVVIRQELESTVDVADRGHHVIAAGTHQIGQRVGRQVVVLEDQNPRLQIHALLASPSCF